MAEQTPQLGGLLPGVDLVDVAQVRESIESFGAHYLQRLHTPAEIATLLEFQPAQLPAQAAARFAAKEAVFKALRLPQSVTMAWTDIEIATHDEDDTGRTGLAVRLHGAVRAWAEQNRLGPIRLSITHTDHHAMALAVAS